MSTGQSLSVAKFVRIIGSISEWSKKHSAKEHISSFPSFEVQDGLQNYTSLQDKGGKRLLQRSSSDWAS